MNYLSFQKRIVTTENIEDNPIVYVRDQSLMPGYALRYSPERKKGFLYKIQKDGILDTEQQFLFDILLTILEEKDDKNKKQDVSTKYNKGQKEQKNIKRRNTYLKQITNHPMAKEMELDLDEAEEIRKRKEIHDTLFIYVLASPCVICFSKYEKL